MFDCFSWQRQHVINLALKQQQKLEKFIKIKWKEQTTKIQTFQKRAKNIFEIQLLDRKNKII